MTVTGSGFAPGVNMTVFHFGKVAASSVECATSSECTVVSPPGIAGAVNVRATVAGSTSNKNEPADLFTYS